MVAVLNRGAIIISLICLRTTTSRRHRGPDMTTLVNASRMEHPQPPPSTHMQNPIARDKMMRVVWTPLEGD